MRGKVIDDEFAFCAEYTEPPAHLQREGQDSIGYVVEAKNGQLCVFDAVRHDVDYRVRAAYDPVALKYSLRGAGFLKWIMEHGPTLLKEGKFQFIGDQSITARLAKYLDLADFFAKHTRLSVGRCAVKQRRTTGSLLRHPPAIGQGANAGKALGIGV
jgi:hypothetical protein